MIRRLGAVVGASLEAGAEYVGEGGGVLFPNKEPNTTVKIFTVKFINSLLDAEVEVRDLYIFTSVVVGL